MENIISRHRNLSIFAVVLFAQILGLAVQVKKGTDRGTSRLIRIWTVAAITPFAKGVVHTSGWFTDTWHNYLYLRNVRRQDAALRGEIERMRLEQVRLAEDASQARRLQVLLGFKEQFISQTKAAQVISTTGSEFSRGIYIDKGSHDGIKPDMPVLTSDGIVGKVLRVYPTSSLVLQINDPSSGVGVILEKSRLQGILKGSPTGETFLANIMADEKIEVGERILSSGGDRVYPKGLAVGTVSRVKPAGTFLNVEVKPSAHLNRLEEVLVITKIVEKAPDVNDQNLPVRAIDILAQRLPSVPPPKVESKPGTNPAPATGLSSKPAAAAPAAKPAASPESVGQAIAEKKKSQASVGPQAPAAASVGSRATPPASGEAAGEKEMPVANTGPHVPGPAAVGNRAASPVGEERAEEKSKAAAPAADEKPVKSVSDPAKPENPAKDTPR